MEADMKKTALILFLALLALPLHSASFFYSVGTEGFSGKIPYGGFSFSAGCSLFDEPYLDIGAEVVVSPLFESAGIFVSTQPFGVTDHPFDFLFANKMLYSPKLGAEACYVHPGVWNIGISLALLNFRDMMFDFEFFTPVFVFSVPDLEFGVGVRVLTLTCYL